MSVTITATPFLLIHALGALIPLVAALNSKNTALEADSNMLMVNEYNFAESFVHIEKDKLDDFFEKDLKTNIVDKNTLVKTLAEYGADITLENDNTIECNIENLTMKFTKTYEKEPYHLYVKYTSELYLNQTIEGISDEYKINVQEASYNKIMENLEAKNLTVEEEEILEDDTIVLTVNLE